MYGYYGGGGAIAYVIGMVLAIAATVLAGIFIMPVRRREKMKNKFMIFLHDIFNFKQLIIEVILKYIYVLATCAVILVGFCTLFVRYNNALLSFAMMILGPIIIRILYEFIMLTILLVKNVIEINAKMPVKKDAPPTPTAAPMPAPVIPTPATAAPVFPAPVVEAPVIVTAQPEVTVMEINPADDTPNTYQ